MRRPASRDGGEGFDHNVVELRAVLELFPERDGSRGKGFVGELLDGGFEIVNSGDDRTHRLDFALVPGAKYFGEGCVDHLRGFSYFSFAGRGRERISAARVTQG